MHPTPKPARWSGFLSIDTLPSLLHIIAEIAGDDTALRVAEAKGGQAAYIPRPENLDADHWLAEIAGIGKAREIAAQLGGRSHVVPIASQRRRQEDVEKLIAEGKNVNEIAHALRIDRRTVRRHLALIEEADARQAAAKRAARKARRRRA